MINHVNIYKVIGISGIVILFDLYQNIRSG